jgi:ParB family chromosome partitioning protein
MNAQVTPSSESAAKTKLAAGLMGKHLNGAALADPRMIGRREGWNPRFDFGEIEDLAASIKANGILNPLRVKRVSGRDDGKVFELIDGDRRLTAVELLLKKHDLASLHAISDGVPVIIVDRTQDDLTSLVQMFVANTGKNFLPLEEAMAYQRMIDGIVEDGKVVQKGMTIKEIARAVGRHETHVAEMLALLDAHPEVQLALKSGQISKQTAKELANAAKHDKALQEKLVKDVIAEKKAAGGDKKKAKAAEQKAREAAQAARKAKLGRAPKIKVISKEELSDKGARVAKHLAKLVKDLGMDPKMTDATEFRKWVEADDKLAAAATFGALQALLHVAGGEIDLAF